MLEKCLQEIAKFKSKNIFVSPYMNIRQVQKLRSYACFNSPVLQFGAPPAIDSGEAKMCTASWENRYIYLKKSLHNTSWFSHFKRLWL